MIVIDAPHFYAAVVIGPDGLVMRVAPILKYMMNWEVERVMSYARSKGWKAKRMEEENL